MRGRIWIQAFVSITIVTMTVLLGSSIMEARADRGETAGKDGCVIVASIRIDSQGGELSAGESVSPIEGTRVVFPPGAVSSATKASLGYCHRKIKIHSGKGSGVFLLLDIANPQRFAAPVSIEVPYDPAKSPEIVIPYQVDDEGKLHAAQIKKFDKKTHRVTFDTFGPGLFTLVYP